MFKASFFKDVGLYDEDFFAYYEDVDLGLRGQLRGWKSRFVPEAVVYHATGSTSSRVKGFTTYQTLKNYPWIIIKNVPARLLPMMYHRFILAHFGFFVSAVKRGQIIPSTRVLLVSLVLTPKKVWQRYKIQSIRKITTKQFLDALVKDLPPNAEKLRRLRAKYWKLKKK